MNEISSPKAPGSPGHGANRAFELTVSVCGWKEARQHWQLAEENGTLTPYQTWRWISAWNLEVEEANGREPFVIVIEGSDGGKVLLPLTIRKIGPARTAVIVGDDHANFKFPILVPPATQWPAQDLDRALRAALRKADVGLLMLANMPLEWQGVRNPLAPYLTNLGPTLGFKTEGPSDFPAYLELSFSHSHRKKYRQKERALVRIAPLRFVRASSADEASEILETFFRLKAERFAELDVPDVFRDDHIKSFMRRSAIGNIEGGSPALVLYALYSGDRIIAIYGGCEHGSRFSGCVNAIALDEATRRYSPGDILLLHVIEDCSKRQLRTFDLGLGEASYKTQFCPDPQEVYDGVLSTTTTGRLVALLWRVWRSTKTRLKQNPRLLGMLQHIRRLIVT